MPAPATATFRDLRVTAPLKQVFAGALVESLEAFRDLRVTAPLKHLQSLHQHGRQTHLLP